MKKNKFLFILLLISTQIYSQKNYTQYVNPFIGTGGHGHTYPGATLPHGMVQLSPDTRLQGWDGCSGYHISDSFIYGFSHTHLSGTGCSDYGDVLLMPGNGAVSPENGYYGSSFSHQQETASPGYYSVKLLDDNIDVELTATTRVGIHHYTFNKNQGKYVILDLKHRDEVIESSLKIEDSFTVTGMRRSKAWADNQYVYFVMKFSQPIKMSGIWQNDFVVKDVSINEATGKNIKSFFRFADAGDNDLYVQVALSPVSIEGAKNNLQAEVATKKFNEIKKNAENIWNQELSKIEVTVSNLEKMKIFYTALYHTAIVPNINMDVDGQYRGRDNEIHKADGFDYYSVFSLWDTYRAAHPLYTIIDKKRTLDYIKTFLVQYQQGGRLPVWELSSCETDCMIGYHSIPVIADAYLKGIRGFDVNLALEAMLASANANRFGLESYKFNGMVLSDDEHESVSKTLEYAYDDYCIALFANEIGNKEVYKQFIKRARYYQNLYDSSTGCMRPRKNGDWLSPFDPKEVNNHFTEANSWQYSFYFPQDINGYIEMIGGRKKLENKLDQLFNEVSVTTGREQSDITGLIGQYAHGNEPSHHIIYLYNYTDNPYKTQFFANKVMNDFYKNESDGLIGNEDCGQMSAWYVLSALGFYPVNPCGNKMMIGSPQFNNAIIHLENGNTFSIKADNLNRNNYFVQSASLQMNSNPIEKKWKKSFLLFSDINNGGMAHFIMGSTPVNYFTEPNKEESMSHIKDASLVLNPIISGGGISFRESKKIEIKSLQKKTLIYYTLDGSIPDKNSYKYTMPFTIDNSVTVKAIAVDKKGNKSFVTTSVFKKMKNDWDVKLNTLYEQQYDGGGALGLIDGVFGTLNWRMGNWQGYQSNNVDVIIDLKKSKELSKLTANFLQDTRSWVVMPKSMVVEVSNDGKQFTEVYRENNYLPIEDLNSQIKTITATFSKQNARYIRLKAEQYGKLPSWHEGAGGDTHIFIDEIGVE